MVLIYCYIRKYKNFVQQEFNFHKDYRVSFSEDEETLSISRCEPDPIQKALFAEHHVEGLQLLVGKTGSGKTNLFQLLGELDEYRQGKQTEHPMLDRNSWAPHTQEGAYFFVYADAFDSYYIECKDMQLPQFEAVWSEDLRREQEYCLHLTAEMEKLSDDIRHLRGVIKEEKKANHKKRFKKLRAQLEEKEKLATVLSRFLQQQKEGRLFWSATFSLDQEGIFSLINRQMRETCILNCYDRNSFSIRPYPSLDRKGYQSGEWLQRLNLPYQQASLGSMCRYILNYIQEVEPGQIKRQTALHISNENFEFAINAPIDGAWERALQRWARQSQKTAKNANRNNRDIFIHDLWVDYCIYLYKKTRQISLFPDDPLSEQDQAAREMWDYVQSKGTFPYVEAAHLPEPDGGNLPRLCEKLASHLDYLGERRTKGLLWQIWTDIRDITQFLAQYEVKYFTPTTFEIPVEILMDPTHAQTSNNLFERMEQYYPDDSDLFDRDLLLYHFTYLSTGELQYARVFGLLSDYLNAPVQKENDPRHYIILLDEPDANLHPELCRQFLKRLLNVCGTSKHGRTCQLLISTHSPFFLSDVVSANILRLDIDSQTGRGISVPDTQTCYFGANIHDIIADGFFLESTIGEYARSYLLKLQEELKTALTEPSSAMTRDWLASRKMIVDQIGDEIIRGIFQLLMTELNSKLFEGDD